MDVSACARPPHEVRTHAEADLEDALASRLGEPREFLDSGLLHVTFRFDLREELQTIIERRVSVARPADLALPMFPNLILQRFHHPFVVGGTPYARKHLRTHTIYALASNEIPLVFPTSATSDMSCW
jgi:hypothetical protein